MTRLFILSGYFYQSLVAIALIFLIGHAVDGASYTAFSLASATSQFVSVLAFEWLQIAGMRFLAGADETERPRWRKVIYLAFGLSGFLLLLVAVTAQMVWPLLGPMAGLVVALALAQGAADLLLTVIRAEGGALRSALLQIIRSSCVLAAASIGAWHLGTAEAALTGMLLGQIAGGAAALFTARNMLGVAQHTPALRDLATIARYGLAASVASVLHMSASLAVRFLIVRALGVSSAGAAGFSIAFDLLQRPFSVLVAALHMAAYPEVVASYERGSAQESRIATARLIELYLCPTIVLLASLVAVLPHIAFLLVPPALLEGFLASAAAICAFAFANVHLQMTAAIVPHLLMRTPRLIIVATGQLLAVSGLVAIVLKAGGSAAMALVLASLATLLWMLTMAGPTWRFGARPRLWLLLASAVGSLGVIALDGLPFQGQGLLASKLAAIAALSAAIAYFGGFLRASPAPKNLS